MSTNRSSRKNKSNKSNQAGQKRQANQTRQPYYFSNSNSGYAVKNSGINMANAGVINAPGRVRDSGQYKNRLTEKKTYMNRRRHITSGKELTTPLIRKEVIEKMAAEQKKQIRVRTVSAQKKYKLPVSIICCIVIVAVVMIGLTCSHIVLNEQNVKINAVDEEINAEVIRAKRLSNEYSQKNDMDYMIDYAVNTLGMVPEDMIQKYYISGKLEDKVEVMGEKSGSILDFPLMSAIFGN